MNYVAPLALRDQVSVDEGGTAIFDSTKLRSPANDPFEVLSIRFVMRAMTEPGGVGVKVLPSVAAQIRLGHFNLTKGFVPLWLLDNPIDRTKDVGITREYGGMGSIIGEWSSRILFEKSILVFGGDSFNIDLQRETGDALSVEAPAAGVNVGCTIFGRYLAPGTQAPKYFDVPYIIPFIGQRGVEAQYTIEQWKNPLLQPLWIERMIGRMEYLDVTGGMGNCSCYDSLSEKPQIEMIDSMGYRVIPRKTPFNNVFAPGRRDWVVRRELGPNAYLNASLLLNDTTRAAKLRPMMALIGYRQEVTP